ncbi:BRCA2 and CDKN1A-interacting protein-like [Gigantopelta aegis]|uniref:BRCA2 and CDKN1A-interacting protein-like n=1 Tax=Gigantopelta aegis TaxID=1735272 RepID=UPI001B8882B6|nr:BRCA2 and CDKN1A-interacting protein-like [Gigantopelta aegis]
MASSKKKCMGGEMEINENSNSGVDEEIMYSDDEEELVNQEVQVDFEANMPCDSDFHGIRTLLRQLFLKADVDTSKLTDVIISQNYIGSVLKQSSSPEDDDDDDDDGDQVFGIFTVLNLTHRKDEECIQQIRFLLTDKCHQSPTSQTDDFLSALNSPDQHVGLLLSERFINIPPEIAVPSFESLQKDLEKAKRQNLKYEFANLIMIAKTYRLKMSDKGDAEDLMFSNPEEELIHELSDMTWNYSVSAERDSVMTGRWEDEEDEAEPLRTVMMFSASKLNNIIEKLKAELSKT